MIYMQQLPVCSIEGTEQIAQQNIRYTTLDNQKHYLWCEFSRELKIPSSWQEQYSLKRAYFQDISPKGVRLLISENDSIDIIDRFCEYLQQTEDALAAEDARKLCPSTDEEYSDRSADV
jgi:hypothetical protein